MSVKLPRSIDKGVLGMTFDCSECATKETENVHNTDCGTLFAQSLSRSLKRCYNLELSDKWENQLNSEKSYNLEKSIYLELSRVNLHAKITFGKFWLFGKFQQFGKTRLKGKFGHTATGAIFPK